MRDVIGGEWLKLRTLRASTVVLAVIGIGIGGCALIVWYATRLWDSVPPERRASGFVSPMEPLIGEVTMIALGVLGVLVASTEYGTGAIQQTLTAVPRRGRLLLAKACCVAGLSFPVALAGIAVTSVLTHAELGGRAIPGITDPRTHPPALLLSMALEITVMALSGLGLGLAVRSTAAAVTGVVVAVAVVPLLAQAVPGSAGPLVRSMLPGTLAGQLAGVGNPHSVYGSELSPPAALAVLAGYLLVSLGAAAVLLHRRDA